MLRNKLHGKRLILASKSPRRQDLLKGLDAIGQTLELDAKINAYEKQRHNWL